MKTCAAKPYLKPVPEEAWQRNCWITYGSNPIYDDFWHGSVRRLNELLVLYSARCNKYPCTNRQSVPSSFLSVWVANVWFDDVCVGMSVLASAAAIPMKPVSSG